MGNAPSHEGPQKAPDPEPEEPFNLDDIPDDRAMADLPRRSPAPQPPLVTSLSTDSINSGNKKKKKRSRKKKKSATGANATPASEPKVSTTPSGTTAESLTDSIRALREREPETFGEYAMSDDSEVSENHVKASAPTENATTIESIETPSNIVAEQATATLKDERGQYSRSSSSQPVVDDYETADEEDTESYGSEKGQLFPETLEATNDEDSEQASEAEHSIPIVRSDLQRFPCPQATTHSCDKTFATAYGAERHGNGHLNSFVCSVCGMILSRHDTLLRHEKRHTAQERRDAVNREAQGPRPEGDDAQREELSSAPSEPGNAEDVALSTQLNKTFHCPHAQEYDCKKTFASNKSAVRHGQSHTSNFVCSICGTKVGRQDTLTKHMKTHTAEERRQAKFQATDVSPATVTGVTNSNEEESQAVNNINHEHDQSNNIAEANHNHVNDKSHYEQPFVDETGIIPKGSELINNAVHEPVRNGFISVNSRRINPPKQQQPTANHPTIDIDIADTQNASSSSRTSSVAEKLVSDSPGPSFVDNEPVEEQDADPAADTKSSNDVVAYPPKRKRKDTPPSSLDSDESSTLIKEVPRKKAKLAGVLSTGTSRKDMIPQQQLQKQSSLNKWAQPFAAGSQLRHPIFNPKSPLTTRQRNVQVIVPSQSRAGPSKPNSKNTQGSHAQPNQSSDSEDSPSRTGPPQRSIRANLASRKGKEKADYGVRYHSAESRVQADSDQDSEDHSAGLSGMATSVARRSLPTVLQRHKANLQPRFSSSAKLKPVSDASDGSAEDSDTGSEHDPRSSTPNAKTLECLRCHRKFTTRKSLQKHAKRSDVHVNLHPCEVCSEEYWSRKELKNHMKQSGHAVENDNGVREKGHFSEAEERRVQKWRKRYCDFHDLTKEQFGDMVTATIKVTTVWPYTFTTRRQFNEEFYNVLPNRDVRSMRRYRERHFQNLQQNPHEWSREDDEELSRLHRELGPKWAEIGQAMRRSSDAVRVRWRNKLQNTNRADGPWSEHEDKLFSDAVQNIAEKSISTPGNQTESSFYWSEVSKLIPTRTAQQCSNHWRALNSTRKEGKWVTPQGFQTPSSSKQKVVTPSKMAQRLAGNVESLRNRSRLSEALILNSDDEADDDDTPLPKLVDHNNISDSIETDDGVESVQPGNNLNSLPRSKVTDKTPSKTLTTSQAFAQTQANTSARRSTRDTTQTASQDPPSPEIPVRYRRAASPLLGTDDELISASDGEQSEVDKPATVDASRSSAAKARNGLLDNDTASSARSEDEGSESSRSSSTTSARGQEAKQDPLVDDEADEDSRGSSDSSSSSSASSSESDDGSSEASASGSDNDDIKASDAAGDEEMDDSMVKDTKQDLFLQSISSSAAKFEKRAQQQQRKKKRKRLAESGESEDGGSD